MRVALGSDHHGILIRIQLNELLKNLGHETFDHGPMDAESGPVDYPEVALEVAQKVSTGEVDRGVLICGTGIGMCITANKFPGIRAAPVVDEITAEVARRHNNLNVLCLSGDMLAEKVIDKLVETWMNTPFDEGRHARRLGKIEKLEKEIWCDPDIREKYPCD
jgi:ribose 5-phosphate isomerase B